MKTFSEWVQENHPEDESLNEELGRIGRALATATLGIGSLLGGAQTSQGAMPQAPQMATNEDGYSSRPFNRDLFISMAKDFGDNPKRLEKMSDFDLWHRQLAVVRAAQSRMVKQRKQLNQETGPLWYIRLGHYYGWKVPKPPEVVVANPVDAVPGSVMTGGGMAGGGAQ